MGYSVIAVFVLLACSSAYAVFVCTPKTISPGQSEKLVIRCDPNVQNAHFILALSISLKTSLGLESEEAVDEGLAAQPEVRSDSTTQEAKVKTQEKIALPRYEDIRRKRSEDSDVFVRSTITAASEIAIVPNVARYSAVGDVETSPYLALTIDKPDGRDLAVYECQVTYMDAGGVKTASEILQVQAGVQLTLEDLEKRVRKIEDGMRETSLIAQEMSKVVGMGKMLNMMVATDMTALKKAVSGLLNSVTELAQGQKDLNVQFQALSSQSGNKGTVKAVNEQSHVQNDNYNEEMSRIDARKSNVVQRQMEAVARHLQELKSYEIETQGRVIKLELSLNGPIVSRIIELEKTNSKAIQETLEDIQMKTIPVIQKNLTDCQKSITELQNKKCYQCQEEQHQPTEEPVVTTVVPTTVTEATTVVFTGPACYVCGNNETETPCTVAMIKNAKQCPYRQPKCMTDIYQDGITRHVYKRCVSPSECTDAESKSAASCSTDSFETAEEKECHTCCATSLCNKGLVHSRN